MEIHCSFRKCSFRQCGSDLNCPADSVITPLLSHDRDIRSHLNACNLNGTQIKTEADLIRLRGGFFKSENTELTICQIHEKEFGIRWRRSRLCTLGYICGKNGKQSKAMTSCAIDVKQSQFISEMEGQLIPIGSGVCVQCRTELLKRIKEKAFSIQDQDEQDGCMEVACKDLGEVTVVSNNSTAMTENLVDDSVPVTPAQKEECHKNNPIDEINSVTASLEVSQDLSFSQTTCNSELSEWQDSQDSPSHKRKALDTFLAEIGISPIKKTLTVSFESASNRTKHDYLKKSKQIMHNILSIIAPKQETQLEDVLYNSKFDDDNSITESVAKAYSSMTSWGTQRQILSLLVQDHSFNELEQAIPTLSRYKYTAARKHAAITGIGMPIPKTSLTREKATKQQIEHFLEFVMSPAIMTDSPFGHCTYKITSGITLNVPKIILNSVRTRTVTLYTKYCEEINFNNLLSERSYMRVLESVEPGIRKSMRGLDNFAADGSQAFDDLKRITKVLGQVGKGHEWSEQMKNMLNEGKQYFKLQFKLHVGNNSEIPDHCCDYALSSEDSVYSSNCDHTHQKSCEECDAITEVLQEIQDAVTSVGFTDQDQQDEIKYTVLESIKLIQEWKKHLIRTVNQDRARSKVLDHLQINEALIERDWAMKFLPLQYRESQSKWFAKRGLSWHISVVTWKEEVLRSATIVHVFDVANQDAVTSTAILVDAISHINIMNPRIENIFVRSDNAGCYHSLYGIAAVPSINRNNKNGITISRIDFSDPQGGKSICDRRAAHIKSFLKRYVNEGNNVLNAHDFKRALENTMSNVQVVVASPPTEKLPKISFKMQNISLLYNFSYDNTNTILTAWKQFEIGNGKLFNFKTADTSLIIPDITSKSVSTITLKSKKDSTKNLDGNADQAVLIQEELNPTVDAEDLDDCSNAFSCPEDGCMATFLKYGQLCIHLDRGKHTYSKEKYKLKDQSRISYAHLIQTKITAQNIHYAGEQSQKMNTLKRGWALKQKREVKRFSEKQKSFMTKKFNQGETTGFKCEPEEVAKEMRSVKDESGKRIFQYDEFLAASQIGSFFSRLALKKRQTTNCNFEECDLAAEENRNQLNQISNLAGDILD